MILQLSPEELIAVYRLTSAASQDHVFKSISQKIEDVMLQRMTESETTRNLNVYENWVEKESAKITNLKNELDTITKGISLEKKDLGVDTGFDGAKKRLDAGPVARGRRKKSK